jgi:hypothetical protein
MSSFSTARHDKNSSLKGCVSKRLTGLLSCYLSLAGTPQCRGCHPEHRAIAVWPFVVRKTFRCLPNGMDQASFAGFAEADANRPIKSNLFHCSFKRLFAIRGSEFGPDRVGISAGPY